MKIRDIIIIVFTSVLLALTIVGLVKGGCKTTCTYDIDIYSHNGYLLDSFEGATKCNAGKNYCFFDYEGESYSYYNCICKIKINEDVKE